MPMQVQNAKSERHLVVVWPLECMPLATWVQFDPIRIVQCERGHQTSHLS